MDTQYDLIIANGRVIDPANGLDGVRNIGVLDGKIAAVAEQGLNGQQVIDAAGKVVTPGFIDIHSHVDGLHYAGVCNLRMGVTSIVAGNCGYTFTPEGLDVGAFLARMDAGFPVNIAFLVGACDLRKAAGADPYKPLAEERFTEMLRLAEKALQAGAIGVSLGIEYAPGTSAKELLALGDFARNADVICPVHIRASGGAMPFVRKGALDALEEILQAARRTRARFHISHLGGQIAMKARPYDALTVRGLEMMEQAIQDGLDIQSDTHPYTAWGTHIGAALLDPFERGQPMPWLIKRWLFVELGMIEVGTGPHRGKRLDRALLRQIRREDPLTLVVGHFFQEDLMFRVLTRPWVMVCSDGDFDQKTGAPSHPRCCGTFPRVLQVAVREKKLLTLYQAIEKMTSMPAQRFRLRKKGRLSPGADADITIFDAEQIADRATYAQADTSPVGIEYVLVGGQVAVRGGEVTRSDLGRSLRLSG
jgi:N-acyl-D-amino-acid deacylase